MANRNKEIRDRVMKMNTAWAQGAPTVAFRKIKQVDFQADINAAAAAEQELADMEAQLQMKRVDIENRYKKLGEDANNVREGVEGHDDFGKDHPLIEAMGFVRSSARKSGLTRKKGDPPKS
jgi:hypothetical protein